ncbi:hydroxymethylpyrimidine/phosphomethylpyrimidine kinase [Nemorincola caseinilytica]|uniref:hydroxymethylpyrimidine kinase n=1 Tax=Nemorincola caseinilytica TaxID=2054315 RepID=A0ABP8N4A3_9BACT
MFTRSSKSFNPINQGSILLSIAGFDPSAGAGLLADIKTFEANGVYGMGVVSALTWQNDVEFDRVEWVDVARIAEQVTVLLRRFDIRYIKIGLIENAEVLTRLVGFLKASIKDLVIVYDPIIRASAGFEFHHDPSAFRNILKELYCITPNIPEAQWLFGSEDLHARLEEESETLNIYLKGGHSEGDTVMDMLFVPDHTYVYPNDRIPNGAKHGSGCVLSAALTAQLALGHDLPTAAERANRYTRAFLASSPTLLGHHKPLVA